MDTSLEILNPRIRWNWRKTKKYNRKRVESLSRSGYYLDCNYHPCKITNLMMYGKLCDGDVEGICLIPTRHGSSCSIYNCAPTALSENEAKERANYIENGQMAYLKKYVYKVETQEQEDNLRKMYTEWNWIDSANP